MADRVIQRHDTAARWQSINPILATGEIGIEIDGAKGYKIGDGKTRWNDLPYPANPTNVVQELGDNENAVPSQKLVTEKLNEIGSQVGSEIGDIRMSINGRVENTYNMLYGTRYKLEGINLFKVGAIYTIKVVESTDAVYFWKVINGGEPERIGILRSNQSFEYEIENNLTSLYAEDRSGNGLTCTINVSLTDSKSFNERIDKAIDSTSSTNEELQQLTMKANESKMNIEGFIESSYSMVGMNHYEIEGINKNKIGTTYTVKVVSANDAVRFWKIIGDNEPVSIGFYRINQSFDFVVEENLVSIYANGGGNEIECVINVSEKDSDAINTQLKDIQTKIGGMELIKFPFRKEATFKQGVVEYKLNEWVKYIRLYNCNSTCLYYIKTLCNSDTYHYIEIVEKDQSGNETVFSKTQINHTSKPIGVGEISGENFVAIIDWTDVAGRVNFSDSVAPLHSLVCDNKFSDDVFIDIPSHLICASGISLSLYSQMILANANESLITDMKCDSPKVDVHRRFFRYTAQDNYVEENNIDFKLFIGNNSTGVLKKRVKITPVKSSSGAGKTFNILCIGASSTEQGRYVHQLKNLFENEVMNINFIGTMQAQEPVEGVYFEGRSGWRARTYFTADGTTDGQSIARPNPFFDNTKEELSLDAFNFSKYMQSNGFASCDAVVFAFGGNDSASNSQSIEYAHTYYDAMIASMKEYNPNIKVGIWLYHGGYYKYVGNRQQIESSQKLHRYILEWYDDRETENIYVLPCGQNMDPIYDYIHTERVDENGYKDIYIEDAMHPPYETGAKKLAEVCYSWIKYCGGL